MALTLLQELQQIRTEQKNEHVLMERVDKFLGHLHAQFGLKDTNPLESYDTEELESLAAQLAGLQLLGRKDDREAMDDFSKIDPSGASKNFFKFLDDIDDRNAAAQFSEKRNADTLLIDIANTHAPSLVKQWKAQLDAAQGGDQTSLTKIKGAVDKMFMFYQRAFNQLKSHFSAGGAFDDVMAPKETTATPPAQAQTKEQPA